MWSHELGKEIQCKAYTDILSKNGLVDIVSKNGADGEK